MNFTGLRSKFLAFVGIFFGVFGKPISSIEDPIRISMWTPAKVGDDRIMVPLDDMRSFAGQKDDDDDMTNVVADKNSLASHLSAKTIVSARDKANEEYRSLWLGDDCRYCDGDFAEDLETVWNYLQIMMITAGVLVILFLLFYVLCRCGDRADCEDYERLSGDS